MQLRSSFDFLLGKAGDFHAETLRRVGSSLVASKMSEEAIACNSPERGAKVFATPKSAQIPKGCDECFLCQVIDFGGIIELPREIASKHQFITLHDLQIEVGFATFDPFDQGVQVGFFDTHVKWTSRVRSKTMCR